MAPQAAASVDIDEKHLLGGNSFMECVVYGLEHTVDLLGCDEQAVRRQLEEVSSTLQASSSSSPASKKKATDWRNRDYAKLHDEFIESLLQEQEQETTAAAAAAASATSNDNTIEDMDEMTEAERKAFVRKQKRELEEMESVAKKSHRERVEDFNEKLGQLTEHNDIPRISAAGNG
mmetsp:Transcript_25172/g.41796  ORF Transcript_25172/g.41796 Transcript_25172/m.41796 type:complete len:176 (+) Transcript_25172:110-637(+)